MILLLVLFLICDMFGVVNNFFEVVCFVFVKVKRIKLKKLLRCFIVYF